MLNFVFLSCAGNNDFTSKYVLPNHEERRKEVHDVVGRLHCLSQARALQGGHPGLGESHFKVENFNASSTCAQPR